MNLVPTKVEEQLKGVDRTRSLVIGITLGLTALFSLYRIFWGVYAATVLSSYGISSGALVFTIVLWGVIGVAAGFGAIAFLMRYNKHP
ncbi:MAG: hypothetical protein QOH60_3313 [Mycobacterium sp.]|jgi:hypothetical protein|nr:hypothetical protein [Mycobacterium sp.]